MDQVKNEQTCQEKLEQRSFQVDMESQGPERQARCYHAMKPSSKKFRGPSKIEPTKRMFDTVFYTMLSSYCLLTESNR
jgi:hypothetical protein